MMRRWVKVSFSKAIRKDHTIQKYISCTLDDFDFDSLKEDVKYFDTTEIKISAVA